MDWSHLIAFNVTLAAAILSPGPAFLYLVRTALTGGFRAGMTAGAGLGLIAAGWTGAALLGLEVIFAIFPWAYVTLKLLGAGYLLWIAWGLWRHARTPLSDSAPSHAGAFWGGALVNLGNPKSVLFASAVLVVIFPPGMAAWEKLAIVGNHLVVELVFYATISALMATRQARETYLRMKPVFDRVAAGVLAMLGLRLLFVR